MTDDDIKRDRAIIARAIDGPWTVRVRQEERAVERTVMDANGHWVAEVGDDAGSAEFIAEARTRWEVALDDNERLERRVAELTFEASVGALPIPMLLWCPKCGERHIDRGEFATKVHHSHSCQGCGLTWRPAIGPTVGVQFLPGFKDKDRDPAVVLAERLRTELTDDTREVLTALVKRARERNTVTFWERVADDVERLLGAKPEREFCAIAGCEASCRPDSNDDSATGWVFRDGYGWSCPEHSVNSATGKRGG